MTFQKLASYFQQLEKTASRNQMTVILAQLIKESSAGEVDKICYLSLGQLAPSYQGIVFNMAEKMVIRAIAQASQQDNREVVKLFKQKGDLGEVISGLSRKKESHLSVLEVYGKLTKIAQDQGEKSQERKVEDLAR